MTTYWCYFSWIIVYNFVTVYGIATKFNTMMCCVPNFRTIGKWNCILWQLSLFDKKKKNKTKNETQPIFEGSYLRKTWRDLVEIWNGRWWRWPAFPSQKSVGFIEVSQSYICVKIALLFFLLITHGCGTPASWAARYTTVCLDLFKNSIAGSVLGCSETLVLHNQYCPIII